MKRIFITYGDANYADQKERICHEAMATCEFDEARAYGPEFPFPDAVRRYIDTVPRGGGYWLWKPLIIRDALDRAEPGDIVVYADAGSSLHPHKDWQHYLRLLRKHSILLFRLNGKIGKYCKRKTYETLSGETDPKWLLKRAVTAAVIMIKKGPGNGLIDRWANAAEQQPELFAETTTESQEEPERPFFKAHRHDQAVLNVLLHTLPKKERRLITIQPERFDHILYGGQAITLTRLSTVLKRNHHMKRRGRFYTMLTRLLNI